jgi:hypothetical protein
VVAVKEASRRRANKEKVREKKKLLLQRLVMKEIAEKQDQRKINNLKIIEKRRKALPRLLAVEVV